MLEILLDLDIEVSPTKYSLSILFGSKDFLDFNFGFGCFFELIFTNIILFKLNIYCCAGKIFVLGDVGFWNMLELLEVKFILLPVASLSGIRNQESGWKNQSSLSYLIILQIAH